MTDLTTTRRPGTPLYSDPQYHLWLHLPNARLINSIRRDIAARPEVWDTVWSRMAVMVGTSVFKIALDAAYDVALSSPARGVVWTTLSGALAGTAWIAFSNYPLAALIAWDSSAALLALTPDALRTIIDTCDGDVKHQAVLLLPAVIARSTT